METKVKRPKKVNQAKLVEEWKDVPEGTPVMFRKTTISEWQPSKTTSGPFLLGGHTACIMLEDVSGAFSLEFVRKA